MPHRSFPSTGLLITSTLLGLSVPFMLEVTLQVGNPVRFALQRVVES